MKHWKHALYNDAFVHHWFVQRSKKLFYKAMASYYVDKVCLVERWFIHRASYNIDQCCMNHASYNKFFQHCTKLGSYNVRFQYWLTLYKAGFVYCWSVQCSIFNIVQSKMASYNVQKTSTLYKFTLYNVNIVWGTTV